MSTPGEVVAVFKIHSRENRRETLKAGRPIFNDIEVVEMRIPGDRERVIIQPAHHVWRYQQGQPLTFAMRFADQYRRFREGGQQLHSGTPLSQMPDIPQRKVLELKALSVFTVEQMANIEGQPLKALGMGAVELKRKAQEFLDRASGAGSAARLTQENADMRKQLEALQAQVSSLAAVPALSDDEDTVSSGPFAGKTANDLKEFIAEKTGARPRGNPSVSTLQKAAEELMGEVAA